MKRILLSLGLLVGVVALASAQVNVVPQVGLTTAYLAKTTYSSSFVGLVPVSSGTDVVCIAGSATKKVTLQRMTIYGTAATAVQTLPVMLLRRTSVDTGGTPASTTANPGTTTQIAKRDVNSGAASATLISYTANPTIVDSSPTYLDSAALTMPVVTSVTTALPANFDYVKDNVNLVQAPVLSGAAAQICANINGASVTNAAVWNGVIVWTEE